MHRFASWRAASLILIGALASRAVWFAWQYYFAAGPRYRVESAIIALVVVGLVVVLMRRDETAVAATEPHSPLPIWWLPLFIVVAIALYAPALGLGFLSDDYTLRAMP